MKIRSPKDFWSGLFFLVVAPTFILLSRQYHWGDMHKMGPALFPTLVGVLLAFLGLVIVGQSMVTDGPPVPRFYIRPIAISLVAIALFGIALAHAGLIVAITTLVAVSAFASNESKPIETIGLIVVLIAFSVAVFVWLLGLPIPLWPEA